MTTTRGGLGNFGKALASAGIGEAAPPEDPPVVDTTPEVNPAPEPAPVPEPAETPVEEPKTEDQGFDVAGPADPPPTEE